MDILTTGILSACNDLYRSLSGRGFASNSRFVEVKVKERIKVSAYLLKEEFNQVFPVFDLLPSCFISFCRFFNIYRTVAAVSFLSYSSISRQFSRNLL